MKKLIVVSAVTALGVGIFAPPVDAACLAYRCGYCQARDASPRTATAAKKQPNQARKSSLTSKAKEGGVYVQHDARSNISDVRRTGQTNDFARRASEHNRKPETKNLVSVEVARTNDPAVKRGLENKLYDANRQAARAQGGLNKVRPPAMKPGDKEATDQFLRQIGGASGRN